MEWLQNLMFGNSAAHALAVFAIVIALGVALGKVKIFGISLGITWVLFVGIAFAHFGMGVEHNTLHFIKEFGFGRPAAPFHPQFTTRKRFCQPLF